MQQIRKYGKSFFDNYVILSSIIIGLALLAFFSAQRYLQIQSIAHPAPQVNQPKSDPTRPTLRVVAAVNHAPYSFLDTKGEPSGHDIELAHLMADKLGMNAVIRMNVGKEARRDLINGNADLLMGVEYTPDHLPELNLSIPFQNDPFLAFGTREFSKITQLYAAKIAISEKSGQCGEFLQSYRLQENVAAYPTCLAAFQSIDRDENDYAIARHSVGRRTLVKMGRTSVHAVGPALANNYLCVAVNNADPELLSRVNAAIIELAGAGEMARLENKWLGNYARYRNVWDILADHSSLVVAVLSAVAIVGMLLYLHVNRRLLKAKEAQHESLVQVLEYQQLLTESTKGLYESIHEFDITNNRAVGESTAAFFQGMGIPADIPYDAALRKITQHFIKVEHGKGYLDRFLPENVLAAFQNGTRSMVYELLSSFDGENYYWLRITARIFHWQLDNSVRMITYRQNIDAEKKHEMRLLEKLQLDPMTNLYNKAATERIITDILTCPDAGERVHALMILDIDAFKGINDTLGHAFGDYVITHFATTIKKQFRESDIVGRIGGDEFALFLTNIPGKDWIRKQAQALIASLCQDVSFDEKSCRISASIGIALYPESGSSFSVLYKNADAALYLTKRNGKNNFTIHTPAVSQRRARKHATEHGHPCNA